MQDQVLSLFEQISLETLNERALLHNRTDRKFVLPADDLEKVLGACLADYQLLSIGDTSRFGYHTVYYDTDELLFYHQHHRGKGNRCKVRTRSYGNTGLQFIEVKRKTNKGKTEKFRCQAGRIEEADAFLLQHAGFSSGQLHPVITIHYNRITLLHRRHTEKVTFDLQLTCSKEGKESSFSNLVIAEVKTEKNDIAHFSGVMKKFSLREGALSKYCLGMIALDENIKHNNFKADFTRIEKINMHGNI